MFCVEWSTNTSSYKNHMLYKYNKNIKIGWAERFMGIVFWPAFLAVFFYNFFKQYFK